MFEDVSLARAMRKIRIANWQAHQVMYDMTPCPICHRRVDGHNSAYRTPEGWLLRLPCWRRGEWDRYGLHINPTAIQADEDPVCDL